MYNTFFRYFGLRENPFNVNPNPGYLYLNQKTGRVLEEMAAAIQARKGLIVLTGDAGTGKTTVINRLKQWLHKQRTPTAFIFNPHLEVNELFQLMLAEYGISNDPHLRGSSLARLNQWLLERHQAGHNAVLILDEAQGLPLHVLEQVRMLLNHEMPEEKLLQVVLSGQPELEDKLKRPEMRQLRQRISLRCYTSALTQEESRAYINRRLQIAGGTGTEVFSPEAVEMIHLYARGIPRVMNLLCEHAMIRAFANQSQPVSASSVQVVAKALQFDDVKPIPAQSLTGLPASFSSAEFPEEVSLDDPLDAEPAAAEPVVIPSGTAIAASAPLLVESEAENPHVTWFEATLDANAARQDMENSPQEPEKQPRPVLVAESRNSQALNEQTAVPHNTAEVTPIAAAITPIDEPHASQPHVVKKPIAITSKRKSSKQAAQEALSRSQDYLLVLYARGSQATLETWEKLAEFARSEDWQGHINSLLRWLQQPMPSVKVHRRAGD